MNIVIVDKLGDIIAFKPKEIQVRRLEYDQVPKDVINDFEVLCRKAKDYYNVETQEIKSKGGKPNPMRIKSESIVKYIYPFMNKYNIKTLKRGKQVVKGDIDKTPKSVNKQDSNSRVKESKVKGSDLKEDLSKDVVDKVRSMYNNFNSEELSDELKENDSKEVKPNSNIDVVFSEGLFNDGDDIVIVPTDNITKTSIDVGLDTSDIEDIISGSVSFADKEEK